MTDLLAHVDEGSVAASGRARTRMCAVSRAVVPENALIRFVAAPDDSIVADLKRKLPGRGVWVGLSRASVAEAVRKNAFARALKRPVRAPADLPDQVAARLREAALGRLGLARKAGAAVAGFAKVEASVGRELLAALLIAADAAADSRRKMEQALNRRSPSLPPIIVFRHFGSEELSLALGLPNVIHAAVLQSPAGISFVEAALRLQRYEGVGDVRSEEQQNDSAAAPQDMTG